MSLSEAQRRFIDEIASLLRPWGMQQSVARIYGYLLLSEEPVTLDQMVAELDLAKSSASVAARLLERAGLARRHGERGSKRARYEASEDSSGLLAEKGTLLGTMGALMQARAPDVAAGKAHERITALSHFYFEMRDCIEQRVRQLRTDAVENR